jgi:predicted DNA binding CopG/RHH family protein
VHENSANYIDWSKAQTVVLPALKPSLRSISLRLPESLLERIKQIANKKDIPYQSLIKIFLSEKVDEMLHSSEPIS